MKFIDFLKKKDISEKEFEKKTASEIAQLQNEYSNSERASYKEEISELVASSKKGLIDKKTFDAKFKEFSEKLEAFDPEAFKQYTQTLEKFEGKLKEQGTVLRKLEDGDGPGLTKGSFRNAVKEALETEQFKEFAEGKVKKASFPMKAVSITDDYSGSVHVTARDKRVVDTTPVKRLNIRDLLTVMPADFPYLAFIEVYDWDRQVDAVSENGALSESAFKVREATVDAKRIGTHIALSKRMLRSASFVLSFIMQKMPALVRYMEDFQLLWGDGEGNNVLGIFKQAQDFTSLVNTPVIGGAGAVASVASYDGGAKTLITFTANQRLNNGDIITLAGATEASYNGVHKAIVINPKQFVVELAYIPEANTSAWTFTVASPFKNAIDAGQEIDVLKVAKTLVTVQEYTANGIVLNPVDATKIETLKGSDEHYIDVKRLPNGILTIAGIPVVETTAIPAGKFVVGDWAMAAALGQFTELVLEFSESTQEKLTNSVEAIIQEEILFPIYNKYMFVTGDFSTAIAAIAV